MAVSAYTLVRTEHQRNRELFEKIRKLRVVKEVTLVYGEYDMIVKTKTESLEELTNFIYTKLRRTSGITMTTTMITANINKK